MSAGAAAAADGGGEAVPQAAGRHAGAGAARAQPRHAGLRQPRPPVHLYTFYIVSICGILWRGSSA